MKSREQFDEHAQALWFRRWEIRQLAHKVSTYLRIRDHLAAGGTVVEDLFQSPREWSSAESKPAGSFVPEFYTPERLAEHLTVRHCGWGSELSFIS